MNTSRIQAPVAIESRNQEHPTMKKPTIHKQNPNPKPPTSENDTQKSKAE